MKSVKCPECGFVGWADSEHCKKCGVLRAPDFFENSHESQATYAQYQAQDPRYSPQQLKKGLAVASLVIGIIDLFTLGLLGLGAIAGITLAIVALSKAKRNPYEYGGQGLAIAGLVMSILSVLIIVPLGIVAAIAVPNLLASRRAANEGSSMSSLRIIYSAQATFQATVGNGKFGSLEQLGSEGLISPELANGIRHGYRFTVTVKATDYDEPAAFRAIAVPLTYGTTGTRSFYVDETGIMRAGDNRGADATEFDAPLNVDGYSSSSPPSRSNSYDSRDY